MKFNRQYKTEEQLINAYNYLAVRGRTGNLKLSDLTREELHLFITAQTINFGRTLEKSLINADYQLEDQEEAINRFSHKTSDSIFG